jgi:hypothetical protein
MKKEERHAYMREMAGSSLIEELELKEIINTFDYSLAQPWIIGHSIVN